MKTLKQLNTFQGPTTKYIITAQGYTTVGTYSFLSSFLEIFNDKILNFIWSNNTLSSVYAARLLWYCGPSSSRLQQSPLYIVL